MSDVTPQDILDAMTGILQHLDAAKFRVFADAGDDVTDKEILEAMHRARLDHPGINRTQKNNSKRWLATGSYE